MGFGEGRRQPLENMEAVNGSSGRKTDVSVPRMYGSARGHALKYPSKFFEAVPARLVDLVVALDGVRRVHALGAYYNPKIEREPGEEGPREVGHCPICGNLLLDSPGYHFIFDLQREGRRDVSVARVDAARAKVLAGSPP
jgi:hypothetical protein